MPSASAPFQGLFSVRKCTSSFSSNKSSSANAEKSGTRGSAMYCQSRLRRVGAKVDRPATAKRSSVIFYSRSGVVWGSGECGVVGWLI